MEHQIEVVLPEKSAVSIDILTHNNIFPIISTQQRSELTEYSKVNPKIQLETHMHREFKTISGHLVIISGPVLGAFDHTLSSVLIAIYLSRNNPNGGVLRTTYKELREKLKLPKSGPSTTKITRGITRLKECTFKIFAQGTSELLWGRSIIKDWDIEGSGRLKTIFIELNQKWILGHYDKGNYSIQDLPVLANISGDYATSIYRLISSQKNSNKVMISLKDLWEYLVVKTDTSISWVNLDPKIKNNFLKRIRIAIEELKKQKILSEKSRIYRKICTLYRKPLFI